MSYKFEFHPTSSDKDLIDRSKLNDFEFGPYRDSINQFFDRIEKLPEGISYTAAIQSRDYPFSGYICICAAIPLINILLYHTGQILFIWIFLSVILFGWGMYLCVKRCHSFFLIQKTLQRWLTAAQLLCIELNEKHQGALRTTAIYEKQHRAPNHEDYEGNSNPPDVRKIIIVFINKNMAIQSIGNNNVVNL